MATYFDHMHLLHISYAAHELDDPAAPDYVRARRYPRALAAGSFDRMQLSPDYADTGLFLPGQTVRVVVLNDDDWLFLAASSNGNEKLFAWSLGQIPALAAPPGGSASGTCSSAPRFTKTSGSANWSCLSRDRVRHDIRLGPSPVRPIPRVGIELY